MWGRRDESAGLSRVGSRGASSARSDLRRRKSRKARRAGARRARTAALVGMVAALGVLVVQMGAVGVGRGPLEARLAGVLADWAGWPWGGGTARTEAELLGWLVQRSKALDGVWQVQCSECDSDIQCAGYLNWSHYHAPQLEVDYPCAPFPVPRCCARLSTQGRAIIVKSVFRQFKPFLSRGISRSTLRMGKKVALAEGDSVLVQVIQGQVYVAMSPGSAHTNHNFSTCSAARNDLFQGVRLGRPYSLAVDGLGEHKTDNPRARLGLRHMLLLLQQYLDARDAPPPDFEFLFTPHSSGVFPSRYRLDGPPFPSFGVTKRHDMPTLVFPRHDGLRDVDVTRWDDFREQQKCNLNVTKLSPDDVAAMWLAKQNKAVFRGNFITRARSNGYSETGKVDFESKIGRENWKEMGRPGLLSLWPTRKDVLNIGYLDFPISRRRKYGIGLEYLGDRPSRISLENQLRNNKLVIAAEGAEGWCEHLRYLLLGSNVVVKQQTPYVEWLEEMLTAENLILHTDSNWKNLTKVVDAALADQNSTLQLMQRASEVAEEITSVEGEALYAHLLFEAYSNMINYSPYVHTQATKIVCKTASGVCLWKGESQLWSASKRKRG